MRANTNGRIDGGLNRISEEGSVMELERRVGVIQLELPFTTSEKERRINSNSTRGIPITKQMVWGAYKKVKRNGGSGGVDLETLSTYEASLSNNLYKLWNRLSSGIYFPSAVLEKSIPKGEGKHRFLGIPTISDRIAQQVIKDYIEPRLERIFHESSYGYRPGKNAHHALEQVRDGVWRHAWVIDMDIKGFFDEVSHELLQKALDKQIPEKWVKLYIQRWLEAPVQKLEGHYEYREGKGTPQGGVISPLLSNLFLHYVFDRWMEINHSDLKFVRYADDIIVHCSTKCEAELVLCSIQERMQACGLELHKDKTKLVYCKQSNRQEEHKTVSFDFLGYRFQPRTTRRKAGGLFLGYDCGISQKSSKRIASAIRKSGFQRWTGRRIEEIANFFNPKLQGWLNYYGKFRKWNLHGLFKLFQRRLIDWVRNRYKHLNKSYIKACKWLRDFKQKRPNLFVHWQAGFLNA